MDRATGIFIDGIEAGAATSGVLRQLQRRIAAQLRFSWRELLAGELLAGLGLALWLGTAHGAIFAHGRAWVIGVTLDGTAWRGCCPGVPSPCSLEDR